MIPTETQLSLIRYFLKNLILRRQLSILDNFKDGLESYKSHGDTLRSRRFKRVSPSRLTLRKCALDLLSFLIFASPSTVPTVSAGALLGQPLSKSYVTSFPFL